VLGAVSAAVVLGGAAAAMADGPGGVHICYDNRHVNVQGPDGMGTLVEGDLAVPRSVSVSDPDC
jgi:hypothetical protein